MPAVTAGEYLRAVFAGAEGFIEFRLIGQGKTTQHFIPVQEVFDRWAEIEPKLLAANKAGANCYYGAHARTDRVGDAAHIKECRIVYADLDYKDPALLEKNYAAVKGFNLTPTFAIDTGHGYHLIWLLKEPVPHAEAEKIMRTLARVLAGDHVWDAPRILRLPGTMNVKVAAEPVPCEVVKADPGRAYNAGDFEPLEGAAPGIPVPGKAAPPPPRPSASAIHALAKEPPPSLVAYGNGHGFAQEMANTIVPYWQPGVRHKLVLGIAGLFRKDEVPEEGAAYILQKVANATDDGEIHDRLTAVKDTYGKDIDEIAAATAIRDALGERAQNFLRAYGRAIDHIPPPPLARPTLPDFDLYRCLPPESMFEKYVQFAYEKTDAPLQYHAAAIITVAAAALGNRVRIPDFHGSKLHPNLYTLLVGPSSRYRKSTSINIAHTLATDAKVPAYPNNATVEQLYVKMCPHECEWREEPIKSGPNKGQTKKIPTAWEGSPCGIIYHREFSNFLSASAKSYNQGSRDFMTDLYDGIANREMSSRETKTQGKYFITDPALNMLCAVTPSSMRDFVTKTDIKSGFLSRFFVCMYPPVHENRFGWYRKRRGNVDLALELQNWMEKLAQVQGDMDITQEAEERWVEFDKWINSRIKEIEGTTLGGLDSFLSRLSAMAVKIAMIYAWGTRNPAPVIEAADMNYAIGFCKYSAAALSSFFDAIKPDEGNRELRYKDQVLDAARNYIKRNGIANPIPHRTLLQNSNLDAEQFNRSVESLKAEGRFTTSFVGRSRAYILNEVEK